MKFKVILINIAMMMNGKNKLKRYFIKKRDELS